MRPTQVAQIFEAIVTYVMQGSHRLTRALVLAYGSPGREGVAMNYPILCCRYRHRDIE